jgi:uncharacterized protein (TIGR02117 family)
LKTVFKYLFRGVLIIVGLLLFYLLSAFGLSRITINKDSKPGSDVTIYIRTNGIHTDIVVPVKYKQTDWSTEVSFSNTKANDTALQWLAIGWGDKAFYLETPTLSDLKFRVVFNAAFGLSQSAIHATFYRTLSESEACKKIVISEDEYSRLSTFVSASFEKDTAGHVKPIGRQFAYSGTDAFYEGTGTYSLFYTCNTWANNALKISGQKSCLWTPFDKAIFAKYD